MTQESTTLQSIATQEDRLRAQFRFDADRFAQSVLLSDRELLVSCEPSEPLAGPVFQEVYRQATPAGGQIAFLTGMADNHYWSASIEAAADRLAFDFACRTKGRRAHVAAEYRLADDAEADLASGELRLTFPDGPSALIRPTPVEGHPTCQLMLAGRVVVLAPGEGFEGDPRWAFEVVAS